MKAIFNVAAALPLLMSSALAATATTSITCRTAMGTVPVNPVPSSTRTTTDSIRPTVTLVAQRTITTSVGYVTTSTLYTTTTETTTDPTITDTYTTTTTLFDISTVPVTSTVTTTSTETDTTSSTSTTEIATTQGFQNIADTLNSYTFNKRGLGSPYEGGSPAKRAVLKGKKGFVAQSYPTSVICTKGVQNINTQTVFTSLPRATKTIFYLSKSVTETDTITTTSTIIPDDVTSTDIETSFSTVTTYTTTIETDTETSTTTTTNIIPGPTVYDACNSNNYFGPNFQHGGVAYYAANVVNNGPGVQSDFNILSDGASSVGDCCYACQQYGQCETFIFRSRNRNCFLLTHKGESCSSQSLHPNYILSTKGNDPGSGYVVGNGNCGFVYSGNSDGSVFTVDGY